MKRIVWLIVMALVAAILFYLSRFWGLMLWTRGGLFGVAELRPQGGLVDQWLRGTNLAPFELLIWAIGAFLVLTVLQKLYDRLNPPPK
jgi:hypothetical protein